MALLGLLILWPVLLVVAIMIKVKMPGGPDHGTGDDEVSAGRRDDCGMGRTDKKSHGKHG